MEQRQSDGHAMTSSLPPPARARGPQAPSAVVGAWALLTPAISWAARHYREEPNLLDNPFVIFGVLFLGLLVGIKVIMDHGSQRGLPGSLPQPKTGLGKKRLARSLIQQRRFKEAGDLFAEVGMEQAALDAYLQAGASGQAARILERRGDLEGAAQAYEAAKEFEKAARLRLRLGQPKNAARCYQELGQWKEAAKLWSVGGDHDRAAAALFKAGDLMAAAAEFQRAGRHVKAGETYLKLLERKKSDLAGDEGPSDKQREAARLAGRMFEHAGKTDRALAAYKKGGHLDDAVRLLVSAGRHGDAGKLLMEAGRYDEAVSHLELGGEKELALKLKARLARKHGRFEEAAAHLVALGSRREAAELLRDGGEHLEAAKLFEQLGDMASAALAYETAGDLLRAAKAYEAAQSPYKALELYRSLKDERSELRLLEVLEKYLDLGKVLVERGDLPRAVEVLKKIQRDSPDYRDAAELLGDLYLRLGDPEAAVIKYRHALGALEDEPSLELQYKLGMAAQAAGLLDQAREAFQACVDQDPTFKDARARLRSLAEVQASEPLAPEEDEGGVLELVEILEEEPSTEPLVQEERSGGQARYEFLELLGRGGMGEVYRAMDLLLGREVAYKTFSNSTRLKDPERLLREARIVAKLNHVNIVTVFDAGEVDGVPYITMEILEGEPLSRLVQEGGPLGIPFIKSIFRQACSALGYAHEQGVIHRDLKPQNMFWTRDGLLKITDFGLAKAIDDQPSDNPGVVIGTPYYISPEQIRRGRVSPRSDIYSLGVTVYELTCGRVPFGAEAEHIATVLDQHLHQRPVPPSALRPDCPRWLEDCILWCLQKNPAHRPRDVAELWSTLEAAARA